MSNQDYHNPLGPGGNGAPHGDGRYFGEKYSDERKAPYETDSDEIDLKQLLSVLLRYKWWVVAITFLVTISSVFYALSIQPVYQSDGTILISENRNRYSYAGADLSNLLTTTYGIGMGSTLTNELQVFQSRRLSHELADIVISEDIMENGRRFPILWRDFPDDSTVVSRDSVSVRIRENMTVNRIDRDSDLVRVTYRSYSPVEAAWLVDRTINTYTELSTEQNRQAANSALNFLEKERDDIEGHLNRTEDALLNYMRETQLVQVDSQTEENIRRIAALEGQRQELQVKKVAVASALEAYENQLEQIRPGLADQFAESAGPTLERFQYRLAELETERLLLLQRNPQLRSNPESEPYLVELNEQIRLLRTEINRLAVDLIGEDDAFVGFLTSDDGGIAGRLTELRSKLIELRIEEAQFSAQEEVIDRRLAEENRFFENLPDNMVQLARLRRDAEINEQLYLTISRQYAETALWEQTQFGLGRPLDYAYVPEKPSEPKKRLIVMVGFLLGGILGVGVVFLRDMMNRTIDGTEKVRRTGYPLLAVIPDLAQQIKEKNSGADYVRVDGKKVATTWVSVIDSISPAAESYRRLHNNIIYSHPDEKFQTILVTSSNKGEGKTTVSSNLAVALAESGKKVLLVDTDLRRPAIHSTIGLTRQPGLMEVLFDDVATEEVIRPTIAPGVDVITAGRKPPNPSSVMQSARLRELIKKMKEHYDHILIDSPPYGIITDAAPMMRLADGVVLISRFGVTQTNQLNQTIENLKRIRAKVIGTVITSFDHENSADYYYSSNYYYNSYEAYQQYHDSTKS